MSARSAYHDRVRPALGPLFFERRLAVWNLELGFHMAEALARTGVRRQSWFDDGTVGAGIARSFGAALAGRPRAAALAEHCAAHNTLEDDYRFEPHPRDLAALRRALERDRPALLLASIDEHAPAVCRAAIDAHVPLLMTMLPATDAVGALQLVWHPQSSAAPDALLALAATLARAPRQDPDLAEYHVDALEARSQALSIARWILAPDSPERPDLREPLVERGRAVVLRGQPRWPWEVRFARPEDPAVPALVSAAARPGFRAPTALCGNERVLVLGLGTASLFCAEAHALGRQLAFVDCKPVSAFNPVRQIYGTEMIGRPKGEALVEILRQRLPDRRGSWHSRERGPLTVIEDDRWSLAHAQLRLREADPGSMSSYRALLDELRPTLAIVALGRSRDDNFTATAELRRRGIRHITPTAFPGVSHYKHVLTDGARGPCYDCLQGHLAIDGGAGPTLGEAERELYYGGTQPASLAETLPSAHSLLRLARDLALPPAARPPYLAAQLARERNCWVGANRVERSGDGWLYGVDRPFKIVTYGVEDLVGSRAEEHCPCGRVNRVAHRAP